jgi:hypothetical protein
MKNSNNQLFTNWRPRAVVEAAIEAKNSLNSSSNLHQIQWVRGISTIKRPNIDMKALLAVMEAAVKETTLLHQLTQPQVVLLQAAPKVRLYMCLL